VTHKFELCGRRDQVVNDDVSVSTAADKLGATLSTEYHTRNSTLVEGELMSEFESRGWQLVWCLFLRQHDLKVVHEYGSTWIADGKERARCRYAGHGTLNGLSIIDLKLYFTSSGIGQIDHLVAGCYDVSLTAMCRAIYLHYLYVGLSAR